MCPPTPGTPPPLILEFITNISPDVKILFLIKVSLAGGVVRLPADDRLDSNYSVR